MDRKVYISDGEVCLSEYISEKDDLDFYNCWLDEETQKGYNHIMEESFDEFKSKPINNRFIATILRCCDRNPIGIIFVSPETYLPDMAIMIFESYRDFGYGTRAFQLGVKYCFEILRLDKIYAGCYLHNIKSMKILQKCGFIPHPEGDQIEKHHITGEDITQLDYVKYNYLAESL